MEKIFLIFIVFLIASCQSAIITPQGYEMIQPGTPVTILEEQFGPPYQVEKSPNGFQEYTYIQRTPLSAGVESQVTYTFNVCNGKVISKSVRTEQSLLDFNGSSTF